MKKFRILGVIAILVLLVDGVSSFFAGWGEASDSFKEGVSWNLKEEPYRSMMGVSVEVNALETTRLDSIPNAYIKECVPYKIEKIRVPFILSPWSFIIGIIGVFALFAVFAGLYCLIRMLISISRRDVFTQKNVTRMRVFTYSLVAFYIVNGLMEWLAYMEVVKQVSLPGYEIKSFYLSGDWVSLVVIVLFTEIFAIGLKMKEEQDLTI